MATVMLLVIGIVGTTVAPWQLFFQQSYVIDKRITPRFMKYEKADLGIGIVVVVVGAAATIGLGAVAAAHLPGQFTDAADVARGLTVYGGRVLGDMFAVALLDASIIGAFAVSLSTAYAMGDCLKINHSLHRGVKQAKGFYAVYAGIIALRRDHRAGGQRPRAGRADGRRAGAGRGAAALGVGLPAAAVHRQGGARPVGERPRPRCSPRR